MKKLMLVTTTLGCLVAAVAMAAETPGTLQTPSAGTTSAAVVSEGGKETPPAAYTIEELYKNGAALHKKKVVVRGQAVKVTSGIMGKTWTHIQDGTGDKNKHDNDVICISSVDLAQVGDLVVVTGTVIFKPASRYTLVIEDATIN